MPNFNEPIKKELAECISEKEASAKINNMLKCEIIKKQQEYIKQLEQQVEQMKEDCKHTFICKNCKHFIQHYFKDKTGRFLEVNCGHCIGTSRVKRKEPNDKTCNIFESKYR